jgi:hypothetical protein
LWNAKLTLIIALNGSLKTHCDSGQGNADIWNDSTVLIDNFSFKITAGPLCKNSRCET